MQEKETLQRLLKEYEEPVLCAEGYLLELQRRAYCKGVYYIPEIILEKPHVIESIHEEFAHAGSDILIALLYYVNRKKLAMLDLVEKFEQMNKQALDICRRVSERTHTVFSGNLCNSIEYNASDSATIQSVRDMFREQVLWAVEAGVDMFVCETFREYGEALLALQVVKEYAPGVDCVVTLAPYTPDVSYDGIPWPQAVQNLYDQGATVAGYNCARGPDTMLPLVQETLKTYTGRLAVVPLPYRTTPKEPTWLSLRDYKTGKYVSPDDNDIGNCSVEEIRGFGESCRRLGVHYVGLCCGNSGKMTRALAHGLGLSCPADKYRLMPVRKLSQLNLTKMTLAQ